MVKFHAILTSLAGVLPLYLKINVVYWVCHLSGYLLPQFFERRASSFVKCCMDIEDVHVARILILIFINI
jgi:hypothetical protein